MGKVNTFLQPLPVVTTVVFVVTKDACSFLTSIFSDLLVLVKANTFSGARSNGVMVILDPVLGHVFLITSLSDLLPPSELLLLLELRLKLEAELERAVIPLRFADSSDDTNAALTSAGRDDHASRTELGRVALSSVTAATSSL